VAAMCGNGSRAAALYAYENELGGAKMSFLTGAGKIVANIYDDGVEIAFSRAKMVQKSFKEAGRTWHFYDTGVPHLVNFVENLDEFDLNLARLMREKYNANVNFATILPSGEIGVRTYERGVENETNACGTGMAACFWTALQTGILGENLSESCQNEADFAKTNAKLPTFSAKNLEGKTSNLDEISSQNMTNLKENSNESKANLDEKQIFAENEILTYQSVILRPKSGEKLYFRAQDGTIFFKGAVRHCFDAEYFLQ
jgi:diaminopimelate epimerase